MSQKSEVCLPGCPVIVTRRQTVTETLKAILPAVLRWLADRNRNYRQHIYLENLDDAARRDLGLPTRYRNHDPFP